jgi:hypothetical protein
MNTDKEMLLCYRVIMSVIASVSDLSPTSRDFRLPSADIQRTTKHVTNAHPQVWEGQTDVAGKLIWINAKAGTLAAK